jgi:CRISP-associated protein Cas1
LIVEISSHGSVLRRDHETFIIVSDSDKTEVPAEKVDAIVITSNALVSTQAVRLCLERNIQLVITDIQGRPLGRFWTSTPGKNTQIRRNQYLNQNTKLAFDISVDVTTVKLKRQKDLLEDLRHNRRRQDRIVEELEAAICIISRTITKLSQLKFSSGWKQSVLGIEGSSAAVYFRVISALLPSQWIFKQRSQHPAEDGFNAVLNYIYGMGYADVEKIVILSGLDPNAGFYHADSYGRPTFSFDLMEMARPLMDRTVISLFTKRLAAKEWFEAQQGTPIIFLSRKARSVIIEAYSEKNQKQIEKETWDYCRKIIKRLGGI